MTLRRQLVALCLTALGCESIAPRTTPDASVDAGATLDAPDVIAADVVDAQMADIVDAPGVDALDVMTTDIVDAPALDAPNVVTADIVDAAIADTPDVVTADIVDASIADTPDVVTSDVVDASVDPFPSTGADGPFPGSRVPNDAGVIELEPRVWNFTTITVPTGLRVHAQVGNGVLELRATGDVLVQGIIDLSGGAGGSQVSLGGVTGLGGTTGTPVPPRTVSSSAPIEAALGGAGTRGVDGDCMGRISARGGSFGGGSSGGNCSSTNPMVANSSGGGGGGFAGGGGGLFADQYGGRGGEGASHLSDEGGTGAFPGSVAQGGEARLIGGPLASYAGRSGGRCEVHQGSAGAGGSIGRTAAQDLGLRTTFRPGSGGGGAALYWNLGNRPQGWAGGGGGGGGGALRLASPTSIVVTRTGRVLAVGGAGGRGPDVRRQLN